MTDKKVVPGEGKFNITKVAMGGANENLPDEDVIDFLRAYPKAEIGVHLSRANARFDMPRYEYTWKLLAKIRNAIIEDFRKHIETKSVILPMGTVCLHIDGDYKDYHNLWPYKMANFYSIEIGIPYEIMELATFGRDHHNRLGLQLNPGNGEFKKDNASNMLESGYGNDIWRAVMPSFQLILPIRSTTQEYCRRFNGIAPQYNMERAKWHCDTYGALRWEFLFDESGGTGKLADKYALPLDNTKSQGYAGGFGVENIATELEKIYTAIVSDKEKARAERLAMDPYWNKMDGYQKGYYTERYYYGASDTNIWVSAENKLLTDDGKTLDLGKAEQFYKKVMEFERQHTK